MPTVKQRFRKGVRREEGKKSVRFSIRAALTVRGTFSRSYIQPSVSLPLPTASSEVDQVASPFVSEEWGYVGAPVRLLLRVKLPQLLALPERTWLRGIALFADARSFAIVNDDV